LERTLPVDNSVDYLPASNSEVWHHRHEAVETRTHHHGQINVQYMFDVLVEFGVSEAGHHARHRPTFYIVVKGVGLGRRGLRMDG
jgi:hypothetical protein